MTLYHSDELGMVTVPDACDCKLGKSECDEAQKLHAIADSQYRVWQSRQTAACWKHYETARDEYRAHINEVEKHD